MRFTGLLRGPATPRPMPVALRRALCKSRLAWSSRHLWRGRWLHRPAQVPQHEEAQRRENRRDELGGRNCAEHDAALVTAEELDHEAHDRVQPDETPERAPGVRLGPLLERQQHDPDEETSCRLVKLRRM